MFDSQEENGPVFRFHAGGSEVTVMFSTSGAPDVKEKIRDILTESYGERVMEGAQAHAQEG